MDGGACSATVHGVAKSRTQLSDFCFFLSFSSCGEQGVLFVEVLRLLTVVASLVAEKARQLQ